jgi:hypothetical protein
MAEFFPPVLFEIKAKATEAIATFGEVNKELAKMEKNGVLASGALGRMEKASRLAGTALLGLGGAFAAFGVASVATLDKVEKAQANLETAVKNTGVSFDQAKPTIDAHAKSMMALGFTYDDTYAALAKMTAASGSPKVALDSLSVAADLARAKNMSLAEAGTLVARASIGQAKGLGDLGIALGKTLPKGATMAQIFKAIEDRVGGAANAFKNTLSGGIAVANANFQALQVEVGTALVPSLISLTDWIVTTGIPHLRDLFNFLKDHKQVVLDIAAAFAAIWAVSKITSAVQVIIGVVKTLIGVYRSLQIAAGLAAIAEGAATGGGFAIPAAAGAAAVAAALGVSYLAYKATHEPIAGTTGATESQNMEKANAIPITPNFTGTTRQTFVPQKKTSIKSTEKLRVGGSSSGATYQINNNIYVDSAKSATHNNTLGK